MKHIILLGKLQNPCFLGRSLKDSDTGVTMNNSIFGPVVLFSTSSTILSADSDLLTVVCLRIFALLFSLPNKFFLHILA